MASAQVLSFSHLGVQVPSLGAPELQAFVAVTLRPVQGWIGMCLEQDEPEGVKLNRRMMELGFYETFLKDLFLPLLEL